MKKVIIAALTTLWTGGIALADVWTGSGSLYDGSRNLIGTYDLTVNMETAADGTRTTAVKVTLPDGTEKYINCQSSGSENKWSKELLFEPLMRAVEGFFCWFWCCHHLPAVIIHLP
jgi:hypothetical protein